MFIINPKNFCGCQNTICVNLENKDYSPGQEGHRIYFYEENAHFDWIFDTVENRDKAIEKIDHLINKLNNQKLDPVVTIQE